MDYPKYPENLNNHIKVKESQKKVIQRMLKKGTPKTVIATKFRVSPTTIHVLAKSKEEMQEINRQSYLKRKLKLKIYNQRPDVKERRSKVERRKRELQNEDVNKWRTEYLSNWRKKHKVNIPA